VSDQRKTIDEQKKAEAAAHDNSIYKADIHNE